MVVYATFLCVFLVCIIVGVREVVPRHLHRGFLCHSMCVVPTQAEGPTMLLTQDQDGGLVCEGECKRRLWCDVSIALL
jgi:hypothetical protein